MDKNTKVITLLTIGTIIFILLGSTFAYLSCTTNDSQKTLVNFTVTPNFSCSEYSGGDI